MGARYRQVEFETATPEALVVKLYEGAMRFARLAVEHDQAGRVGERGVAIGRALAIVGELQQSLNFDVDEGQAIAERLHELYTFVNGRLLEANVTGRMAAIQEALQVLEQLNEAWVEVARNPPSVAAVRNHAEGDEA
ncbi:MAG: flagellar export chaperone FliS [Proteobacteria bacterium]|nr:flagellar export chaperone FliS [Pseudomonadota bacterium]